MASASGVRLEALFDHQNVVKFQVRLTKYHWENIVALKTKLLNTMCSEPGCTDFAVVEKLGSNSGNSCCFCIYHYDWFRETSYTSLKEIAVSLIEQVDRLEYRIVKQQIVHSFMRTIAGEETKDINNNKLMKELVKRNEHVDLEMNRLLKDVSEIKDSDVVQGITFVKDMIMHLFKTLTIYEECASRLLYRYISDKLFKAMNESINKEHNNGVEKPRSNTSVSSLLYQMEHDMFTVIGNEKKTAKNFKA